MTAAASAGGAFVGRAREMAELRGLLAEAKAGRGRMTVVRAEPGMGKTRLAEELAAEAGAMGVPVVWGRCSADSGAPPLWPLRRIAEQLPGPHAAMPTAAPEAFGSSAEGSAAARFAQFVWLADAVVQAAQAHGLLMIVEDLHWADSATAAALGHLAAEVRRSGAIVLATARFGDGSDSNGVTALLDRHDVGQSRLSGLDRGEILVYLRSINRGPVDEQYADLVLRQTAGNSLYVGAVSRLLAERVSLGSFDANESQAALTGRPELLELIREPVSRVSEQCRGMVEFASVAGEEFDIVELSAAMGQPADSVLALVDEAVQALLLTRPADVPGKARFVHALVREGVYDIVDRATRSRAHRALAAAIDTSDSSRFERIGAVANHLARGAVTPADHLRASAYSQRAGQAALGELAYPEAGGHFGSALYSLAMAGGASSIERAEILLDLAFAEYRSGTFGASLEHCQQVADLAEAELRWDLLARAALLVDGVDLIGDSLLALCHRALAMVPVPESAVRAQLRARLAYAAVERGEIDRAQTMSAEALTLAEQTDDPAALIAALRARHQALGGAGYAAERLLLGRRAIELADRGEPLAALWGRLWRVDAAFELGDLVAVDQELAALAELTEELRFPLARWHLLRLRAAREGLVGHFTLAEELARAARELAGDLEDPSVIALYHAFRLCLCYVRGSSLDRGLDDDLHEFLAVAARIQLPIVHTSIATWMTCTGDLDEAARMARRLTGEVGGWPLDAKWIVSVAMLANVVADVQDQNCAERLYPLLEPFAGLAIAGGAGTVECEGSVSRPLGRLAATCGRFDVAERHLHDAIAAEDEMGARPFEALSRMYLAEVLQARGGVHDLASATKQARTALAAMRAMGMPGRAAQCEQLLTAIEAGLTERTALTPREREIVALVAGGKSNREIAARLFVSERTVETHVSHVLAKLGANSRTDIATWAVAGGLIPRPTNDPA